MWKNGVQAYGIRNRREMNIVFSLKTVGEENFEDRDTYARKVFNKF
jgi:hypothetical protein